MKHFRIISSSLIGLLMLALAYNIICVTRVYRQVSFQTSEMVRQSLRDADLDEVLNRSEKYPLPDSTITYKGLGLSQSRNISGDTLIVTVTDATDSVIEIRKLPIPHGTNYSDIMVNEIGYGAHQTIDPIWELNIADIDSLFRLSLNRKGISPEIASVVRIDAAGNVTAGYPALTSAKGLESCSIIYNTLTGDCYRAYYSPLNGYVFRQMAGIVVSTSIIIALLTAAFVYLFQTVRKLHSLEEMKDDFINNMTHELKTPIAIAYSANDALLNFDAINDSRKKISYLEMAQKQLKRLSELVENILAMSMDRRDSLKLSPEKICTFEFVREIASAQQLRADKEINIKVSASVVNPVVTADRFHLANILNNLIDNAIKYSGERVDINIICGAGSISVKDNGIGIQSGNLPYVFDRFYRVPHGNVQSVRGYGIGLFYVKSIMEKMGGSVSVASRPGYGSVFTVKFNNDEQQDSFGRG